MLYAKAILIKWNYGGCNDCQTVSFKNVFMIRDCSQAANNTIIRVFDPFNLPANNPAFSAKLRFANIFLIHYFVQTGSNLL